jgi:hypothetical protein
MFDTYFDVIETPYYELMKEENMTKSQQLKKISTEICQSNFKSNGY